MSVSGRTLRLRVNISINFNEKALIEEARRSKSNQVSQTHFHHMEDDESDTRGGYNDYASKMSTI